MAQQVTHVQILAGGQVSAPFSLANARQAGLLIGALDPNPGSFMVLRLEAGMSPLGIEPTSSQYLPIVSQVVSGNWHIHTGGSCAVSLNYEALGFDNMRVRVSSVLAATTSIMVVAKY